MFGHRPTCESAPEPRGMLAHGEIRPRRCCVDRISQAPTSRSVRPRPNIRMFAHVGQTSGWLPKSWPNHSDVRPSSHLRISSGAPRDVGPQRDPTASLLRGSYIPSADLTVRATLAKHQNVCPRRPNIRMFAHVVAGSFRCSAIAPLANPLRVLACCPPGANTEASFVGPSIQSAP